MTLIQLISEQTMPNLLAMIRLRPDRVVHLFTERTKSQSYALKNAAKALGLYPQWQYCQMSDMPSIRETHDTICHIHDKNLTENSNETTVIHFTGGTKLMSIGAYAAASSRQCPSLYVDTFTQQFMDGQTSPVMKSLLAGDHHFQSIYHQLHVEILGIANGINRITSGKDWPAMVPLARCLFDDPAIEVATHQAVHGPYGLCPNGREPRDPKGWLELIDTPVTVPGEVASLAVTSGIVRQGETPHHILLPDTTVAELTDISQNYVDNFRGRYFQAIAPLQHAIAFLTGAWWEIIVCEAAHQSGYASDVRWSCLVGDDKGLETETDILGMDGVELLYISCKRGGDKSRLLPLLEETKGRANTIGGSYNRRFLAILHAPKGKTYRDLIHQANAHGIRLITRENVHVPEIFSKHYRPNAR
jgi:hypothetical protein